MATVAATLLSFGSGAERQECRVWSSAKFEQVVVERKLEPGLYVLSNHDPVQVDGRNGSAINVAGKTYKKGLYCHAPSDILVVLPEPGKSFQAVVGLDHNEDTRQGRGSVVFETVVRDQTVFRSPVMRYGSTPETVKADLQGATQFRLKIGDAGDGIGWDQSDWADAQVQLGSGKTFHLSDLPLRHQNPSRTYDNRPPFSFLYGGKPFLDAASWRVERSSRNLSDGQTEHALIYRDPATGLVVRCLAVEYSDFPTVEWTVTLKNEGQKDTPVIQDLRGIDTQFDRGSEGEFTLYHQNGSPCQINDFEPYATELKANAKERIATEGGRASSGAMPYFNLSWADEGRLIAVGWPGQWAASFERDGGSGVRISAGQETTHFMLHPGESVRTPLIAMQFSNGDRLGAQNLWRRWMLAHNLPKPNGKVPEAMHVACSSHQFAEMINATEANQKQFVDLYGKRGMPLEYWWMDAGWYPNDGRWYNTGTWEVDSKRFPNGLRAVSDYARSKNTKTIVWFEPERVNRGTWLYTTHPEWLIGPDGDDEGHCKLLDLGNPTARQWLIEHIDGIITSQGIDLYRQDFNISPLSIWQSADTPDRQGITENHYVTGYLAYWDELLRRHPNMLIDTCASGGRRLDLETLRRSVPLLRSDYIFEPVGQQGHTYGLSFWVPFQGTGCRDMDPYHVRSIFGSSINSCWDVRRDDLDYATARKLLTEWREIAPAFLGDYTPLTDYTLSEKQWIAWQFAEGDWGVVQAFRHAESPYESARFQLSGIDPQAKYEIKDYDAAKPKVVDGRTLLREGLLVTLKQQASAATIRYRKL